MATNITYARPKGILHTVVAGEYDSGIVNITWRNGITSDNPTNDLISVVEVETSAGVQKTGFKKTYNVESGLLTIENEGSFALATDDIINVIGMFV